MSSWVVHVSARPPIAANAWADGWAILFWETSDPPEVVLEGSGEARATQELTDMVLRAEDLYHRMIGPSSDEFVFTVWGFETMEEMYRWCGDHLMATNGLIPDWSYP